MRWEKTGGASRVRVIARAGGRAAGPGGRARAGASSSTPSLTDVFQVQADIATKVADALGVALADSTQRELAAKPTENLAAYDEYLKGEAASQAMGVTDPPCLRRAIVFYEQRRCARFHLRGRVGPPVPRADRLYGNSVPDPALGRAGAASPPSGRAA